MILIGARIHCSGMNCERCEPRGQVALRFSFLRRMHRSHSLASAS
jgi:hypothetical protein